MSTASSPTISERIAVARLEAGLTQEKLAQAAGLSLASIAKWESGQRVPRVGNLRLIAAVTGKPMSFFFEEAA